MQLANNRPEGSLLRRALLANAAFSGICGVLIVLFDERLVGTLTHVSHQLWPLGGMLLVFSASLAWFSTRPTLSSVWVNSVIAADLAWVIGTVVLLLGWSEVFSTTGLWTIAIVGAVVLSLAELQWFGLRRLRKTVS